MPRYPAPPHIQELKHTRPGRLHTPPKPPAAELDPPEWLTEASLKIWNELAPEFHAVGCLTTLDKPAFGMLCDMVAMYRRTISQLTKIESTYTSGTLEKVHPLVGVVDTFGKAMAAALEKFGGTPLSRTRLHIQPPATVNESGILKRQRYFSPQPNDEFEAFLARKDSRPTTTQEPLQ